MHALNYGKMTEQKKRRAEDLNADSSVRRISRRDILADAVAFARRERTEAGKVTRFLDRTTPLKGASHYEVDTYGVDIPMRYASMFAILRDGRKVRLRDSREFSGWIGWTGKRSFLLQSGGRHIEILTNGAHSLGWQMPGKICDVIIQSRPPAAPETGETNRTGGWISLLTGTLETPGAPPSSKVLADRKFIAPDGSQLVLPA